VPAVGVSLDNRFSHQVGAISPSAPAYAARYGYVPPYLRTASKRYAHMTDGRIAKQSYYGEVPFRQVIKRGIAKQIVSSPGRNRNVPQYTAQDVLVIQSLQRRGII